MKSEEEIRKRLEKLKKDLKNTKIRWIGVSKIVDSAWIAALKWVLDEKELSEND